MLPRSLASALLLASSAGIIGCTSSVTGGDAAKTTVAKPVVPQPALVAKEHLEAGKRLADEKHYEQAVEEFTEALKAVQIKDQPFASDSHDADILYQRGLVYLEMNFPDTAAEDFSAVIRQRPDAGAAYGKRGRAYVELGDFYRAVRDCTTAIRWEPKNAEAYHYRGLAYLRRGQFERTVADLQQAARFDPSLEPQLKPYLAKTYHAWGQQLASAGDNIAAQEKLAQALELDPTLAEAVVVVEEPALPSETTERIVAKPVLPAALEDFEQARQLQVEGKYDAALMKYTEAIALDREFADAYLRRAETLSIMGFPDSALKDLDEVLRLNNQSVEARRLQAEAFAGLDSPHRAIMSATDALHIDPSDARCYAIRGSAYVEMGQWDRGIADLEEAGRRDPALKAQLAPTLAEAYRERDEAAEDAQEATARGAG